MTTDTRGFQWNCCIGTGGVKHKSMFESGRVHALHTRYDSLRDRWFIIYYGGSQSLLCWGCCFYCSCLVGYEDRVQVYELSWAAVVTAFNKAYTLLCINNIKCTNNNFSFNGTRVQPHHPRYRVRRMAKVVIPQHINYMGNDLLLTVWSRGVCSCRRGDNSDR